MECRGVSHGFCTYIYIYILYINVPKPYQLSSGRVRHLGAGSCFGVAGLVRVFCRLTHKYFFVGLVGGRRAVVMYPMYVWRRGGAFGPCNSGMSICFCFCIFVLLIFGN